MRTAEMPRFTREFVMLRLVSPYWLLSTSIEGPRPALRTHRLPTCSRRTLVLLLQVEEWALEV
jgi:hypothetical protein